MSPLKDRLQEADFTLCGMLLCKKKILFPQFPLGQSGKIYVAITFF
jgi:hypothetical protein